MRPFKLNLADMKKVSGDKNSSTFMHPSGHKIMIAHAKLEPIHRKAMEAMPVHNYADGGDVNSSSESPAPDEVSEIRSAAAQNEPVPETPSPGIAEDIGAGIHNVVGDTLSDFGKAAGTVLSPVGSFLKGVIHGDQPKDQPAPGAAASTQGPSPASAAIMSDQVSAPQAASGSPQSGMSGLTPMGAYGTALQGINAEQQAESGLGAEKSKAIQAYQDQLKSDQAKFDAGLSEKANNIQSAVNDIKNGHIDPHHYVENMSVPGKIATAIGMILGGAGAGAGRPNPGMEFLNKQIDRDIQSQRENLANKSTLLGAYQDQYKNSMVAENMTRATMLASHMADLDKAAANAIDPLSKARALQAKAQLQQQILPLVNNANLIQMGQKFNGQGGSGSENEFLSYQNAAQRMNPELYKDLQSKYIPGMGIAKVPVDKEDRSALVGMNQVGALIDKAVALQSKYGNGGAWSVKDRADANAIKQELNVGLNELSGLKRLNDREYTNYGQQIGNIGGVNAGGTVEGLKQMKDELNMKRNVLGNNLGLTPFAGAQLTTGLNSQQNNNLRTYMRNNPGVSQQAAMTKLKQAGYL